jgi:hypothetical protein
MAAHELTWSKFLREPTSVEQWLERGDVLLKRREGETLRLSREPRDTAQRDALLMAIRLLTLSASKALELGDVSARDSAKALPWTRFLSKSDRRAFVRDFLDCLEACADLGDFAALGRLLEDWKATAALHAEGLAPRLRGAIKSAGSKVSRP